KDPLVIRQFDVFNFSERVKQIVDVTSCLPDSIVVSVVGVGLLVVDGILSQSLVSTRSMFAIRITIGSYSCVCAMFVFKRYSAVLCDILGTLGSLAAALEPLAHPEAQARMRRTAVRSQRVVRFFVFYGATSQVLVGSLLMFVTPLWTEALARSVLKPITDSDAAVSYLASTLRFAVLPVTCLLPYVNINAFYCLILCMIIIYNASADLYDAIGRGVENGPCHREWLAVQAGVLKVLLYTDATIADTMPHLLVVSVVLPLLSTVEVVSYGTKADVFALLMAPLIFTVFVPLCLAGDGLVAAREGMSTRAWRGPWLEESLRHKKLRLSLMQFTGGRGAQVRGTGIGLLDRPACGNALRSWFSFLQVLINVQRQSRAH
ncbi:Protein crossbronx-like, partial [Frankliniella fusca]